VVDGCVGGSLRLQATTPWRYLLGWLKNNRVRYISLLTSGVTGPLEGIGVETVLEAFIEAGADASGEDFRWLVPKEWRGIYDAGTLELGLTASRGATGMQHPRWEFWPEELDADSDNEVEGLHPAPRDVLLKVLGKIFKLKPDWKKRRRRHCVGGSAMASKRTLSPEVSDEQGRDCQRRKIGLGEWEGN
jgi:hypothetical protein